MANLTETASWDDVYQIEVTDPVEGGAPNPDTLAGVDNVPHLQLLRRTKFLRDLVESAVAVVGVTIPAGGHIMSSDHVLMKNATGSGIEITTGATAANLTTDGFIQAFALEATQAEVNGYSDVVKYLTPDLLEARTLDVATVTQSAQTVAHDTLSRMFYTANGGAAAYVGAGATRFSFSNSALTLSKKGIYAVRGLVWQSTFVANAADIYVQVNKDAAVMAAQTGGAGQNLWGCWAECFAVFQGAAGEVLTLDAKQVNTGTTVRNLNAAMVVSHIA